MIEFKEVSKSYNELKVINKVSFTLLPGRIFGLLGPNGAGKTTLIRMLLDIIRPDTGEILFDSSPITPQIKNKIGYLPEERGLYKTQKVLDTLVYFALLKGFSKVEALKNGKYLLNIMDLEQYTEHKISKLSKGMQQKVQFIATIIFNPEIIILDEPFSGLDPLNTKIIKEQLLELKKKNRIIILSTHQINQIEELCDDILLLNKGKSLINGHLKEIKETYSPNEYIVKSTVDYSKTNTVDKIINIENDKDQIILKKDKSIEEFLKEVINQDATLEHLEKYIISLEDLFINLVGKDANTKTNNNS